MMKKLSGIHHITAITSDAYKIYRFFNDILGLRLVKKTVNQDDVNTYHLFFSDAIGQAGTDMTFFDFNGIQKATRGTDELSISGFRVKDNQSLEYYQKRFDYYDVKHGPIETLFGRKMMFFEDFDGQRYALFSDQTT
ncbi:MAG TPA: ring-cleaving dioxygenase, partial [Acholeplasmataceae bacterium]|nr:ring-cleaving dioxygenase [Acholeplasmataceae bacterium]